MEEVKEIIKQIFLYIDEDIKIEFSSKDNDTVFSVDIKMKEPQILIGEKGQVLLEIERIIKIIVNKKIDSALFVNLDINDYKKRKTDYLISLAEEVAEEVRFSGVEKSFPPMAPFERRVVHMAVKDKEGVVSESVGEGEKRRVVVRKEE